MLRIATVSLISALILLVTACKGDKRSETLTEAEYIRGDNGAGVAVAITGIRQHRKWLVLHLELTNTGDKLVELRNPGDQLRGFTLTSDDGGTVFAAPRHGGYNYWTGYHGRPVSGAAGTMELSPQSSAGLELHFKWPKPYQDRHDYPWTLVISQMFHDNTALPTITLRDR